MLQVIALECLRGGRKLFSDLDFSLQPGNLVHVQGANGSGKTSLLRILASLSSPDSGEILWNGATIRNAREEYATNLLYLGHLPAIKDDLTVAENLLVSCRMSGLDPLPHTIQHALDVIGLGQRSHIPARVLSQGQRRRLALARLWLDTKPLWILDEPYTALDIQAVSLLENRLEQHLAEGGMAVMTTHQRPAIQEKYPHVLSFEI